MRLLDRYLLKELLLALSYCLGSFLIFWIAFDLFSRLDEFQDLQMPFSAVVDYYLIILPSFLFLVTPIAFLLALLYAITNHARANELIAMRSAGRSLARISLPYFIVGVLLSVGSLAMNELLVPTSVERAEALELYHKRKMNPGQKVARRAYFFRNIQGDRIWKFASLDFEKGEMKSPQVEWLRKDGSRTEIYAEKAVYKSRDNTWAFSGGVTVLEYQSVSAIPDRPEVTEPTVMPWPESPQLFKSEIKVSSVLNDRSPKKAELSITEILNFRMLHPRLDRNTETKLSVQLHSRLAEPWTNLAVVLLAVPFAAGSGRRNAFVGVASSIFICFGYFVLQKLSFAFGSGGYIDPILAAWLPNVAASTLGLVLFWRAS